LLKALNQAVAICRRCSFFFRGWESLKRAPTLALMLVPTLAALKLVPDLDHGQRQRWVQLPLLLCWAVKRSTRKRPCSFGVGRAALRAAAQTFRRKHDR
jgi:hypothetical protein